MAKTKTGNGKIYSQRQISFARALYISGEKLDTISKRLGIPVSTLGRFSRAGKWLDDRMPKLSIDDLYDMLLILGIQETLKLMFSNPSEEQAMAGFDRIRKIVLSMQSLSTVAPMESAAIVGLMKFALAKHRENPALEPSLSIMQEFYDRRAGVMNEEQEQETQAGEE